MLWADKYRPKDLSNLDYHKQQALDLKNLTKDGDFPHLLVYGPLGAGVDRLKVETMNFTTPSNKKLEINTVSSNYHIEVNPSDVGMNDRVVIMDVIKNMAQTQQLNANAQREFKMILLTDVENLTKDAQHALRRTMEKYIANCRIILCATSISRVIPAIKSRCLCVRVPAPAHEDIVTILTDVCAKESLQLPTELANRIAEACDRNLRRALLMCEACKVEKNGFIANQKVAEPDWQVFIRNIANKILKEQSVTTLAKVREDLYELMIFGVPSEIIFKNLLQELTKNCDMELAFQIVEQAAAFEHRMAKGSKEIFHLEAFVAKCMCLYQNMMQELLVGEF
ncbi:Rep fac C, DNA pol3 delta2, and/or Rad17 domain containing protein [Asbolus verrucosus]|uniref:Replication factor C subunit 3 n=1 Tax=Asbolus verrucosus TaxID=1661398 RepID=A0A482WCK5_ASBVE|nr:Rep fac C, DNA pol3 delta2, and/or Rad17 domain containing protein [Asbolus verrucosus]